MIFTSRYHRHAVSLFAERRLLHVSAGPSKNPDPQNVKPTDPREQADPQFVIAEALKRAKDDKDKKQGSEALQQIVTKAFDDAKLTADEVMKLAVGMTHVSGQPLPEALMTKSHLLEIARQAGYLPEDTFQAALEHLRKLEAQGLTAQPGVETVQAAPPFVIEIDKDNRVNVNGVFVSLNALHMELRAEQEDRSRLVTALNALEGRHQEIVADMEQTTAALLNIQQHGTRLRAYGTLGGNAAVNSYEKSRRLQDLTMQHTRRRQMLQRQDAQLSPLIAELRRKVPLEYQPPRRVLHTGYQSVIPVRLVPRRIVAEYTRVDGTGSSRQVLGGSKSAEKWDALAGPVAREAEARKQAMYTLRQRDPFPEMEGGYEGWIKAMDFRGQKIPNGKSYNEQRAQSYTLTSAARGAVMYNGNGERVNAPRPREKTLEEQAAWDIMMEQDFDYRQRYGKAPHPLARETWELHYKLIYRWQYDKAFQNNPAEQLAQACLLRKMRFDLNRYDVIERRKRNGEYPFVDDGKASIPRSPQIFDKKMEPTPEERKRYYEEQAQKKQALSADGTQKKTSEVAKTEAKEATKMSTVDQLNMLTERIKRISAPLKEGTAAKEAPTLPPSKPTPNKMEAELREATIALPPLNTKVPLAAGKRMAIANGFAIEHTREGTLRFAIDDGWGQVRGMSNPDRKRIQEIFNNRFRVPSTMDVGRGVIKMLQKLKATNVTVTNDAGAYVVNYGPYNVQLRLVGEEMRMLTSWDNTLLIFYRDSWSGLASLPDEKPSTAVASSPAAKPEAVKAAPKEEKKVANVDAERIKENRKVLDEAKEKTAKAIISVDRALEGELKRIAVSRLLPVAQAEKEALLKWLGNSVIDSKDPVSNDAATSAYVRQRISEVTGVIEKFK